VDSHVCVVCSTSHHYLVPCPELSLSPSSPPFSPCPPTIPSAAFSPISPAYSSPPSAQLPPHKRRIVNNPDPSSVPMPNPLGFGNYGPPTTYRKFATAFSAHSVVSTASFPLPEIVLARSNRCVDDIPVSPLLFLCNNTFSFFSFDSHKLSFHSKRARPCDDDANAEASKRSKHHAATLSDFHVFLDIDGTLVHTIQQSEQLSTGQADFQIGQLGLASFKRPDLEKFLTFCFTNFKSVSLWTAGDAEYAHTVAQNVVPQGCQFQFVLSRETLSEHPSKQPGVCTKNLAAMWTSNEHFKDLNITRDNCLIIGDTPEVCAWNTGNVVIVPSWSAYTRYCGKDTCLERLQEGFLQARVMNTWGLCSEASARLRAFAV
jgi:hypothetical protein